MEKYLSLLIEQFKQANNIKNVDINSQAFISEFSEWIKLRQDVSKNYLALLEYMELSKFADCDTAEVGKGRYDTIVKPFNTTIITPHISGLETLRNERIINAELVVMGETPVLFGANKNGKPISSSSNLTFMTQNPYTPIEIRNWEDLHNSGESDIIVGVYGSIYDKDIASKLKQIQELEEKLNGSYIREDAVVGDTYSYAIASKRKVKTLVKTYIRTR